MRCPRCGHEVEGMARACPSCGYMLPFSLRQARQVRIKRDTAPSLPTSSGNQSPDGPAIAPELPRNDPTGATFTPETPARPQPSVTPSVPLHSRPTRPTLQPIPDAEITPASLEALLAPQRTPTVGSSRAFTGPEDVAAYSDALASTTSAHAALSSGTLLQGGRYRLLQRFRATAAAGPAEESEPPLFVASDTEHPKQRVLVQELPLAGMPPEQASQAMRQVVARLDEARQRTLIPAVTEALVERGRCFVVTAMPQGERLSAYLARKGPLAEPAVVQLGLRLLDAVGRLESLTPPLVHGNLCPEHIFLREDGLLELVGFSPALLLQRSGARSSGIARGIPGYAAPEQAQGQAEVGSDLYAVACVLHLAATDRPAAVRDTPWVGSWKDQAPKLSAPLDAILSQALRTLPAERFASADDMRRALLAVPAANTPLSPARQGRRSGPVATAAPRLAGLTPAAAALRATLEFPAVQQRRRRHSVLWPIVTVLALIILVSALVSLGVLFGPQSRPHSRVTPPPPVDPTMLALYQGRGIGLSAGEYVFDAQRPDGNDKQRGARALAQGDLRGALASYRHAMQVDPADPEGAIYAADLQILLDHQSYVTIVAGVAYAVDVAAAQAELQGIYLAQQRVNTLDLLPGTTRLRVLVADVDSSTDDTTALMRLLVRRATPTSAEHIVAVVGWPDESDTRAASDVLAAAGMPLIAPGPAISGFGSQTYFALAPSITEQGTALAEAAATVLNSQRILVARDPNDAQSSALALAFVAEVQQHFSSLLIARQEAFTATQTTDFSQVVRDAAANGVDTIVLAGRDVDIINLAQAVATGDFHGQPRPHILTGAVALTAALLGIGSSPVAQLARSHAAALLVVRAEALAAHGEWSAAGVPEGQQPSFFVDYQQQFAPGTSAAAVASPDALAILSYDAVRLAATAVGRASHGASSPADVLTGLGMVRLSAPFQGVGGSIAFAGSGAPVAKALALVELTPVPNAPPAGAALQPAVIALLGGTADFCGGVTCTP